MSASPSFGERPPLQGGFRRSFTTPTRQLSFHEKAGLEKADADADILYSHPNARITSFKPPDESIKTTGKADVPADTDYPVDTIETLPWRSRGETLIAAGPMLIEKVRGSTNFLKCQNVAHAILRNSQCWCVDGESKFVLRVGKFKYYRIELPSTTDEDKAKVEEMKKVLPTVLRYERTPCPFIRAFTVDLPDDAITPRRKGAWKRRESSQPNTADAETRTPRRSGSGLARNIRSPPSSYPRNGPTSLYEGERGRTNSSPSVQRRASIFENHRNSSPASNAPSDDGTDSEHHGSEHDSDVGSTTDRSETASPQKQLNHLVIPKRPHPLTTARSSEPDLPDYIGAQDDQSESGDLSSSQANLHMSERKATPNEGDLVRSEEASRYQDHVQQQQIASDVSFLESAAVEKAARDDSNIMEIERKSLVGTNLEGSVRVVSSPVEQAPTQQTSMETDGASSIASPAPGSDEKDNALKETALLIPTSNLQPDIEEGSISTRPQALARSVSDAPSTTSEMDSIATTSSEATSDVEEDSVSETDSAEDSEASLEPRTRLAAPLRVTDAGARARPESSSEAETDSSEEDSESTQESSSRIEDNNDGKSFNTQATQVLHPEPNSEGLDEADDDDILSPASSTDSFHTLASPLDDLSRRMPFDFRQVLANDNNGRSVGHRREISEITITASSISDPASPLQKELLPLGSTEQTTPVVSQSGPASVLSELSDNQGLRQRAGHRRSFSPLPPASTIFTGNQIRHDSGSGHMTKVILQKIIIKPIEVAVLVVHILARIAGGATVSDLLSGELFRRPDHRGKASGFADQLSSGAGTSDTEDDYGVPIRGRRRSNERLLAMVQDTEDSYSVRSGDEAID